MDMKNLNPQRGKEIAARLKEIRVELDYPHYHNTTPHTKEKLLELYGEQNALMDEYRKLWA